MRRETCGMFNTSVLFVNDEFCTWKGIYSDALCCYALVLLGSSDLLLILLTWQMYFNALVT